MAKANQDTALRDAVERAMTLLYHIELIQCLAEASDNGVDSHGRAYGIIDYVLLLNEFIPRLQTALNEVEQGIVASGRDGETHVSR